MTNVKNEQCETSLLALTFGTCSQLFRVIMHDHFNKFLEIKIITEIDNLISFH